MRYSKKHKRRCAVPWILDVVFVVLIILGTFIGVHRGFVAGICKLAGTILSVFIAFSFCSMFQHTLETWFGLTTALYDAIGNETAAYWIAVAISFVALAIIVKLCAWLLGKLFTSVIEKVRAFSFINRFLGGFLGLVMAGAAVFLILTFFQWIHIESVDNYISSGTIVGAIYNWDWFREAATFSWLTQQ